MAPPVADVESALIDALARAVGNGVRAMRLEHGMTQHELARQAHSFRPIIGRIERGVHVPDLDTMRVIAAALGGTLDDLVQRIDWSAVDRAARAALRKEDSTHGQPTRTGSGGGTAPARPALSDDISADAVAE